MSKLWRRARVLFNRDRFEGELAEEMQAHLKMQAEENRENGMDANESRDAAMRQFGNSTRLQETSREVWGWSKLESFVQDVRYAVRMMRRSPGFAAVAVVSLGLGIGANTAVFSVVHAVLLRPLPYPEPDRLVLVAGARVEVSIPEYEFWKEHATSFASAAGSRGGGEVSLVSGDKQEWIKVAKVTADFCRTLGVHPALGREFSSEETRSGGPRAIFLSDGLWRSSFGADPGVLGRSVTLGDAVYTVVGVLPREFWFPQAADAFVPLRPTGSLDDLGMNTQMIARLKPGIGLKQAEAEMQTLMESFRRTHPDARGRGYRGFTLIPYQRWLVGDVRMNLLLLFGAVVLLLLIACSNLASLLLARLAARQKEIAVRLALGSGPGRLLRQFLAENLLLAAAGSFAGGMAAYGVLGALVGLIPFDLPVWAPIRVDGSVLVFALAIGMGTGLLFSLAPFLTSARLDLQTALKAGGGSIGAGSARQRARSVLVVSEVALSVGLLVAAGLLIQTLYRMRQERLGFEARGILTFETPFSAQRQRSAAGLLNYQDAMLERLQAVPGARRVAAINMLPLDGPSNLPTQREGHPEQSIGGMEVRLITPAYFEVMGIPLLRGRPFNESDTRAAPPVILVNETLARRWWADGTAIRDRIVIGRFQGHELLSDPPREVVGIAADTKTIHLKEPPRPTVYVPLAQAPEGMWRGSLAWVVRSGISTTLAQELRRTIGEIDPRQRVTRLRSMDEIVSSTTAKSRFDAWLFGGFAALALLLTAIGVYGLLSFSVARRRNEIGIRMALGASRMGVLKLVLRQGVGLIAVGLILGVAGALAVTRSLSSLLFGVQPADPLTFLGVSALLLCVGLVASYIPARRAARIDPMEALRYE